MAQLGAVSAVHRPTSWKPLLRSGCCKTEQLLLPCSARVGLGLGLSREVLFFSLRLSWSRLAPCEVDVRSDNLSMEGSKQVSKREVNQKFESSRRYTEKSA